ncbi:peptide chain release factor-like protein [Candidatus Peregrinibacteria bacterium CG11_big_fil_rev_8_21_14_0_20_41_10]|nr:MAG: peptide chain release factor-like protein [Candidatus Peregrinibacteria bacterium CG11_big_fil_rev_8_21_14_0_20_41_10]PIZ75769.1 MAG: peptide chain release factor-like protein [Candidatus Peregrinibacteria bacterium CG_4_10_14_0_2_um_filter_41_8]PJC38424.1 MAG: peptide chain release factor-like protein [Candidatus Peregrinibacteria bacterium CG_4_9_14_0_2_um_filter_41_14]
MPFPVDLSPPLLQKAEELEIYPGDISEQFVTGSGKGGQKVNKTSSCVLLRHQPTGTTVKCQKHREQSKNRLSAYKLLILKIELHIKGEESDQAKKIHKLRKQKQKRSKRAKEKMLEQKKQRGQLKESRKPIDPPSGNASAAL